MFQSAVPRRICEDAGSSIVFERDDYKLSGFIGFQQRLTATVDMFSPIRLEQLCFVDIQVAHARMRAIRETLSSEPSCEPKDKGFLFWSASKICLDSVPFGLFRAREDAWKFLCEYGRMTLSLVIRRISCVRSPALDSQKSVSILCNYVLQAKQESDETNLLRVLAQPTAFGSSVAVSGLLTQGKQAAPVTRSRCIYTDCGDCLTPFFVR